MARSARGRPILWVFSLSRLDDLLESVVPEYAGVADVRIFHLGFEDALEAIRQRTRAGEEVDVLVSGGANAAYLREHATVPVVTIEPGGYDVLRALGMARELGRRVGLVTFGAVSPELARFREVFGLDLEQRAYTTLAEAEARVGELAARGVDVVVGPSAVTELSERAGLRSVFLYSASSVRSAIDRAVEIAQAARAEEAKRERVDAILRHLDEGVAAVDLEERVDALNPAMERLLGVTREEALGVPLSRLAPELSLRRVLETGAPELEGIARLGRRTVVANRIPLREGEVQTGAVLSCQDATAFERVDRSLRSQHRPRRFVPRYRLSDVVGSSPAIRRARQLAERYARTDATVLVTGASGTGKELFAQGIHSGSRRRDRPFVAVNCAALPEALLEGELFGHEEGAFTGSRRGGRPGLFEAAHTGTLFLDEVGDVPLTVQTRLLRVLQEREVLRLGSNDPTPIDVRVVAATHRHLERLVEEGAFREDLYYRLAILKLHVPSLAERREDVPVLAADLLEAALRRHGAPGRREQALRLAAPHLQAYAWPGNVRQLENVVERIALLFADADDPDGVNDEALRAIAPELFEGGAARRVDLPSHRRRSDRAHVERVLAECDGNQSEAARRLGIGRTTLWRKLRGGARG